MRLHGRCKLLVAKFVKYLRLQNIGGSGPDMEDVNYVLMLVLFQPTNL